MNYLFFDIECCDGTHICSLGYIITDVNFHILEKKDIIINPELSFRLGPTKEEELKLCYSKETFYKQKSFPSYYKIIKDLLTLKDTLLLGFSIGNDFNFINIACDRYNLKQLNLVGFDIQKLHKYLSNDNYVRALEKVAEQRNIQHNILKLHKSCDDAQLSMYILKNICNEENLTINEIVNKYSNCIVQSKIYVKKIKPNLN